MTKFFKIIGLTFLALTALAVLFIGSTFFWSVKYKVGECITNGATLYLVDSDGPLLKGAYGVTKLPAKSGELSIAMPRAEIENSDWHTTACPKP